MDSDKLEAAYVIMKAIQEDIVEQLERQNFEPAGLDDLVKFCEDIDFDAADILRQAISDRLKGIERVPVVYASWFGQLGPGRCSRCGFMKKHLKLSYNYCPRCGARMDGEQE